MSVETEPIEEAEARVAAWDQRTRWFIIVAAVAPMVSAWWIGDSESTVQTVVDFTSWGIFLVDLTVRIALNRRYLLSFSGAFDLAIVVLTFPWYVLPGVGGTQFMAVFRTARLLRLVSAARIGHRALIATKRLGRLGLGLAIVSIVAGGIVLNNEPPESGFQDWGDALWWAIVSFTTVGYGDYYPVSPMGRVAGLMMMLAGLAALGSVAGVFGTMFGGSDEEDESSAEQQILREIQELRLEVAALKEQQAETIEEITDQ